MNKTVLVTGANRGLGKEVAKQLATRDFKVFLTARSYKKAKKAAGEISEITGNPSIIPFELDVSSSRDLHTIEQRVIQETDRIDVLINNAGVLINGDNAASVSRDIVDKTLETNFYGPVFLTQKLLPLIKKSDSGRIINVSSGMGAFSEMGPGHAAYRFSKTALNGFTASLAADLKDDDILVVSVCPGWVKTDMGGPNAARELETGGASISQLAWKEDLVTGKFYRDGRIIGW